MTHQIRIAGTDVAFPCAPGQTVLAAGMAAGIELPYSCRKGVCASCAGRVEKGSVAAVQGTAQNNEACLPGEVLFCVCTPVSDVTIEPTSWRRVDPDARKRYAAKVFRRQQAAPDVSVLQLRLPAGQRARFRAGQYLQVSLPDGQVRAYSMANPPHESDMLTLHVRHVPGGQFTERLRTLERGDVLEVELPFGSVALDAEGERALVCVAGGTGFAPVKSLLDHLARARTARPVTLVWGARDAAGIYLPDALARWRKALPGFRAVIALETGPAAEHPQAYAGRVDAALAERVGALAGAQVYCCGAPAMVDAVRRRAIEGLGLAPHDFHADAFVPATAPAPA
ncbi:2Fe-2S iron-sulfur cluster binding domain-containing protein [Verticiella sediminum]|uniref:2Fe-2S iron-sulfur cluster binding domain-containing protein n=1 Tax=Verticiella sediminum TaxID=1247510 RepID=A0A556B0B8_9BURK|nr:FAD-binding oxidoreductase [Verticiella sediminum]TSH98609.1 2Fe-2S iron-sulfur cluster binding domain-containing protein [Verticiella sediminum]